MANLHANRRKISPAQATKQRDIRRDAYLELKVQRLRCFNLRDCVHNGTAANARDRCTAYPGRCGQNLAVMLRLARSGPSRDLIAGFARDDGL